MKIELCHFRVGEIDGVSLEMEKWKVVLEMLGHEVIYIAGSTGSCLAYIIEELNYRHPVNHKFVYNAYERLVDYENENALLEEMIDFSTIIEEKLVTIIENEQVELLIPHNILSLGWGLPAGRAFTKAIKRTRVNVLAHHHDFYWERDFYMNPTCGFVHDWLGQFFPPQLPTIYHTVNNKLAEKKLKERYGIEATVIPKVFDFYQSKWEVNNYNRDMRQQLGMTENDLVFLQTTRIIERKAIELAIDTIAHFQNNYLTSLFERGIYRGKFTEQSNVYFVLAGLPESSAHYLEQLKDKASELGVKLIVAHSRVKYTRQYRNGLKIYSLWDAYSIADFVMYPSILEAWGNQLIEAIFAKKPMLIYEYPTYLSDIADKNFYFVSLGKEHTVTEDGLVTVAEEKIDAAAKQIAEIISSQQTYKLYTEGNFQKAKRLYSYDTLVNLLEKLVANIGKKR
ncbi:hypothetical protein BKP37_01340 [Anaerobacillus alkalilacustris]|uniref:Glycosyl transferase family 1 domain-containing protein n=1 Tax=Anaerobacillus alkalilacustris TaxID=393763 RepID=A0A1S2LYC5_9BACI|nr:glycosyltransferase family 4 protein [Anaerobacillus alkalilacustris]OIJ17203.1 hypothetical protein BKP37_01340 [Anaerobacillus alkalilacustris]